MQRLMNASVRRFALTTHITSSVGWLGSVAAFLVLSIAGLTSPDPQMVRAAYIGMHLTTWYVIVPFCLASFCTGLIEGLGTPWGLVRHYWVTAKLLLTAFATIILFLHTQPIDRVAELALQGPLAGSALQRVRLQLVGDASAALFVLVITTILSVYKPWGLTPFGLGAQSASASVRRDDTASRRQRPAGRYVLLAIIGFVLLIVLLHLAGIGVRGH